MLPYLFVINISGDRNIENFRTLNKFQNCCSVFGVKCENCKTTRLAFICSKLTIETLEQRVKYVQRTKQENVLKFLFSHFFGATKGFMTAFNVLIKPFEASQRKVKIKI